MNKMWKILKNVVIGLLGLIIILFSFLMIAKLVAVQSEGKVVNPGKKIERWVLMGSKIVDVENSALLHSRSIFINKGKIEKIVLDSLADYSDYHRIEMQGTYVTPGLIDMHAHIFDRTDLTQYLSHGVTTVRNMMGFPMHLRWKKQLKEGEFPGSRMITAGPTLNGEGQGSPFHKELSSVTDATLSVQSIKEQGYDFIKIYDGITKEQMNAILKAASELNMQVVGHPPRSLNAEELAMAGMQSIEHVEELFQGLLDYEFDEIGARNIAKVFAENEVEVCVTLSAYHQIYLSVVEKQPFLDLQLTLPINPLIKFIGKKQMAEFPTFSPEGYDWTVKKYEFMERLVQILDEEGVTLLFGTDTGPSLTVPGRTVHEEMSLLKEVGLSNIKILKSATIDAADNLGLTASIGTIEAGKVADFLITQLNPLENLKTLSTPAAVANGEYFYDGEAIAKIRALGERKQSWFVTTGNFFDHFLHK